VNSLFAGDTFGVELTANPSENASLQYNGVQVQNAIGSMLVTASGLTFPNSSTQTIAFPGFNNTALTGNPTAPTATFGDDDTSIATTAFVQAGLLGGTAVARNLEVEVRNQSGASIPAGSIVYISGATGNKPLITLSQANNDANSAQTMGFVKTTIANNGTGYVIVRGVLDNIDTSALTEGVQLYLSPTTAGTWTTTKPSAPQHLVYVGIVIRSHPNLGTILVAVQNGYELDELHDVSAQTPADLDLLSYESSTSLWKNKTFSALGLLTSANASTTYAPIADAALTGNVTITSNSATAALTITQDGAGDILRLNDVAGDTTFTFVDALGKVNTVAATTASAGLNVPHTATAPSSPVNGDIWTTTAGVFARINAGTKQLMNLGDTQTVSGSITFSNASQTLGNSTATGTINVASGATISASTKTVNVATGGVSGSTTTMSVGPSAGASTIDIGPSVLTSTFGLGTGNNLTGATKTVNIGTNGTTGTTAINIGSTSGTTITVNGATTFTGATQTLGNSTGASTTNIATGATTTGLAKAVNIGTNGAAGSTTTISLGSTTGTSSILLNGSTSIALGSNATATTPAADTNSTALASTAYVVGQAGSATPLIDGTAAVGTSLRYARQDHVHPTDTSRAALASPTFTGTPLSTTAAVDTNTTQIATTAFVVAQAAAATPLVDGTAAVGTSLRYARADHVHPTDTSRAALASPTFTGTPTLPTGTIATTQSPGNNTTAVATTAFVTAAVPTFAATADTNSPSSTTKVMSPSNVVDMLMHQGHQIFYQGAGVTGTSGAGSALYANSGRWKEYISPNALTAGYSLSVYDTTTSSYGYTAYSRSQALNVHDFSKKIWLTGRSMIGHPTITPTYDGDANSFARISLGGYTAIGAGDMNSAIRGFGWKLAGGGAAALQLVVSNGTTVTTVSSSFTPTLRVVFDWKIYADGAGNVTLYVNDSQVATTAAGPTGTASSGLYMEGVDSAVTATKAFILENFGTKIYHAV
jgi:hypothetical protein